MKYLNTKGVFFEPVEEFSKQYQSANPFPHIVIDDFFNEDFLNEILTTSDEISISNVPEVNSASTRIVK